MENQGTVRILLTTYNGEKYIRAMVDSILAQDMEDWQLILSDDSSKDGTAAILDSYAQQYPGKIIHYCSGRKFGNAQGHFLHLLQQWGDAPYVMFCDQDDVWHPDKIRKTLALMKKVEDGKTETPVLVHTDLRVVDSELNEIAPSFVKYSGLDGTRMELPQLLIQNVVTGCTMMINRSLAELTNRYLPEDTRNIQMHDWWIAVIAAAFGKNAFLNEATLDYRQHGGNSVGAKNAWSPAYIWQRLTNGSMERAFRTTTAQAETFIEAFGDLLDPYVKERVKVYADLPNMSKKERWAAYGKYHMWKKGIHRKIAQVLFW